MRIGIIGAGQLGQMLGIAARDLGMECRFIDPSDNPPAASCGTVIQAPFDDKAALESLASDCDVVTYEFENVPIEALGLIADMAPIYPPSEALQLAQDRLHEKRLFSELNIPLPGYAAVDSLPDLHSAAETLGLPMVVKTRRLGYDGKGQVVVSKPADLDAVWETLGAVPLIAEQWVPFDFEVSCIGARSVDGETAIYPLSRNVHCKGILHTSRSTSEDPLLTEKAAAYVREMLDRLDYVGVLAVEFFVLGDELLANEFAPRVHNSGHWSIEGSETSQFENHVRAVCNMPLGSTAGRGHAGMVNLIGEIPDAVRRQSIGKLHDYGKSPRPGRKLGHVTVVGRTPAERDSLVAVIEKCDLIHAVS